MEFENGVYSHSHRKLIELIFVAQQHHFASISPNFGNSLPSFDLKSMGRFPNSINRMYMKFSKFAAL